MENENGFSKETEITLGKTVIANDPCYEPKEGVIIKNVLPGEYKCKIDFYFGERWNKNKPSRIVAEHKDYVGKISNYIDTEEIVCVDSGQAGIFDKDYYDNIFENGTETEEYKKWYDRCFFNAYTQVENEEHLDYWDWLATFRKPLFLSLNKKFLTNDKDLHEQYNKSKYRHYNKEIFGIANLDDKGVCSCTNAGDGYYSVHLGKNKKGKIVGIFIDFCPSGDK